MELKFNIGDRCKIVRVESSDDFEMGDIIEIDYIDEVDISLPYRDYMHNWYYEDQLELVEEEPTVEEPKLKIEPFAEGTVSMEVPIYLKEDVEELILDRGRQKKSELIDSLEKIILNTSISKHEELMVEAKAMISLYRDHLEDNGVM